ncbi:hypothetical protein ABK040_016469 [Willaertia magna]
MCGGCYAPPLFLLPFILVLEIPKAVMNLTERIDNKIRQNNKQLLDQFTNNLKKENLIAQEKELELTRAIELINENYKKENKNEKNNLLFKRAITKIENNKFDSAFEDLQLIYNDYKENYLFQYVLGISLNGKGEYKEAANCFLKAIDTIQTLTVDECCKIENELIQTQMETKPMIEKSLFSLQQNLQNIQQKFDKLININTEKPKTFINLELLYMRAGISYSFSGYYEDAIKFYTKAIELGQNYSSNLVVLNYYNRGLCYYYSHQLDEAENDFTTIINLNFLKITFHKEDPYKMRALVYGRKGLIKKMNDDNLMAKVINPFTKFVTVFHYRLLDDDNLNLIFSFLTLKDLFIVGSTCKYWRSFAGNMISEKPIHLSIEQQMPDVTKLKQKKNLFTSLFLPKEDIKNVDYFCKNFVKHSMLQTYAKDVIIYTVNDYYYNSGIIYLKACLTALKGSNVERLVCGWKEARDMLDDWTEFTKDNCKVKSLVFFANDGKDHCASTWMEKILVLFKDNLEHLTIPLACRPLSKDYLDQFEKLTTVSFVIKDAANDVTGKVKKLSDAYPKIKFNVEKTNTIYEEEEALTYLYQ